MGLLGFQSPGEGADGGGAVAGRGFCQKTGVHGIDLVLLAVQRCLQIFQRGLHLDRMNLALRLAAQLLDDAGMIGCVNLLGARRGSEQAGGSVLAVGVRLDGKGGVLGVRIRLALKGG